MGRSRTPRYVVEVNGTGRAQAMEWRARRRGQVLGYGKPTNENLAKWVERFNAALKPGGVNEHLGDRCRVDSAKVVDQFSGEVKAVYKAPMFQLV